MLSLPSNLPQIRRSYFVSVWHSCLFSCHCVFTSLCKTHYLSWNFSIPFAVLNHWVYCQIVTDIRVSRYRPSVFKGHRDLFVIYPLWCIKVKLNHLFYSTNCRSSITLYDILHKEILKSFCQPSNWMLWFYQWYTFRTKILLV